MSEAKWVKWDIPLIMMLSMQRIRPGNAAAERLGSTFVREFYINYSLASPQIFLFSWGIRLLLNWIKKEYENIEIIITENGIGTDAATGLNDTERIDYYRDYLQEVHKAITLDGINVNGYLAWCLTGDSNSVNLMEIKILYSLQIISNGKVDMGKN